jgi:hypothetical protein
VVHQNREDEKNSPEFFEFDNIPQNREDEKNSPEFFEFDNIPQNREDEKKWKVGFVSIRSSASCLTSHRRGSDEPLLFSSSGF